MMLVTEEEAREKWCPFGRIPWFDGPMEERPRYVVMASVNRPSMKLTGGKQQPNICRCIASECMAWQWVGERSTGPARHETKRTGICGLAGRPE